ncbi:hypothetical protein FQN49_005787 [Arthroderma sp. PD_2]|nr:hypothetical protein FQN49_005787 [Arthroderma sp. PD_2]
MFSHQSYRSPVPWVSTCVDLGLESRPYDRADDRAKVTRGPGLTYIRQTLRNAGTSCIHPVPSLHPRPSPEMKHQGWLMNQVAILGIIASAGSLVSLPSSASQKHCTSGFGFQVLDASSPRYNGCQRIAGESNAILVPAAVMAKRGPQELWELMQEGEKTRDGFCGIGDNFCSPDICIDSCDYVSATAVQCDENKHCKEGCCSKYGSCGYGPNYCGPGNCLSTCDRRAECDPGGFGPKYVKSTKCPLNVCCSKYGFCGTTKDFCGDKKVEVPSCPNNKVMHRVVGYYEGWSRRRRCNDFWPEQIPSGIYTHLNYAFASIDPKTFEIVLVRGDEARLYTRLTDLKEQDPDLKVNIALGEIFKSLTSFLATYNFDGVDLDWEYPAAADRSGRPEDFENFPKFMANLKNALKGTGGRDHISITLPASYWYLQHFNLKKLAPSVDYFNVMSYDLHGRWDKGNQWTGNFLNSHTNMTEVDKALELIWRNDVNPEKVVLGLAFYGRAFTVESTSCT